MQELVAGSASEEAETSILLWVGYCADHDTHTAWDCCDVSLFLQGWTIREPEMRLND